MNYGLKFISILTGLLQDCGFPLLLALLCLARIFMSALQSLRDKDPDALGVAIVDDCTLGGDEAEVPSWCVLYIVPYD